MKKEDVDKMSLQEACDYAVSKIVGQGGRCMFNGVCSYGDGRGNHCAVGWLLDSDDQELMEVRGGVDWLVEDFSSRLPQLIKDNVLLFQCIQNFHDSLNAERALDFDKLSYTYSIDTSAPHWQQWLEMRG